MNARNKKLHRKMNRLRGERDELIRIEGLHPELWERMVGHLRHLAAKHDPIDSNPPVLTNDRAVMREAADSVERLRVEVTRIRSDPQLAMCNEVVEALERILMWRPMSTEAACEQDYENAREILTRARRFTPSEKVKV